jgi:hypothetical protein
MHRMSYPPKDYRIPMSDWHAFAIIAAAVLLFALAGFGAISWAIRGPH